MTISNSRKLLRSLFLSTALVFVATISAPAAMVGATGTNGCGLTSPTGSSASTYTYDSQTGLWENQYYTWDPSTCLTTAITPQTFTYNWSTGLWDGSQWDYSPSGNSWTLDPVSLATPPTGSILVTPPDPALQQTTSNSSTGGSDSSTTGDSNTDLTGTSDTQSGVSNQLTSTGQSGDASVTADTNAGDATSGDTVVTADVINQLQSSATLVGAATFVDNIDGNVNGDIVVDPSSIVQPASGSSTVTNNNDLTDVNDINSNQSINNTVTLNADSGDATVADDTNAGSATSGSADAVANVVNMINSMISSGQSFVGVINILGDLNGNILMPQQFLDSLIASNAPSSTVTISNNSNTTLSAAFNNDQNIVNNVNDSAQSGNASETANTTAGNATTGSATTKVTLFNLTGDDVMDTNTLLVFVNVLGTWVGLLMNAPAGATAAAFGSNVTQNTTNTNVALNANDQESINNNINVNAQSGNANVADNTNAGNSTSGNANAAANILNFEGSSIDASGWFGILFINIFGNWTGSFGVVVPPAPASAPGGGSTSPLTQLDNAFSGHQNTTNTDKVFASLANTGSGSGNNLQLVSAKKSGTHLVAVVTAKTSKAATELTAHNEREESLMIGGAIVLLGVSMFGIERFMSKKTKA